MTLKELLLSTQFDDVAACIKELYSDQESMILDYKEVFDRLRLTEAIPSEEKIRIGMSEPFFDDWEPWIIVGGCYETSDEKTLGREVQIEVDITPEEAVAHFLWEFTFFGFSGEDIENRLSGRKTRHTHFAEQAFELELRYYMGLIYSKQKDKQELQTLCRELGIAFTSEIWEEINLHRRRCNPIRRKRNYRQKKRIAELEYKDKVEWLIQRLTVNPVSQPFLRKDVDFLFSASKIWEGMFHSYANDKNARVDYLKESIEKYSSYEMQGYERYLVLVTTASTHPVRPDESLSFITNRFTPGKRVQWGYNYDDNLGEEMRVLIVMCDFKSDIKQKRFVQ